MSDRRSILLLCRRARDEAGNVAAHIDALTRLSRHDVRSFDPVDRADAAAELDLDEFDALVVHYTVVITLDRYLPPVLREKIASYRGLKVQFIQDEYRWIDAVTARIRELGIDVLYTCVPEREVPSVYGVRTPRLHTITTLPGYVPDDLVGRRSPPLHERPVDVGYRGRTVPYWLGRLGQEKGDIGRRFASRAGAFGLRCDISADEDARIYGEAWNTFLSSCRATLGTESGASIADFDGSIERRVRQHLVRHPDATFEEVEREILAPFEGNVVINTVSPRVFEAAALRTALVMFPGEYSAVVEPWRHYIPIEKDFSNMSTVVARLRDDAFLAQLTERAHADLVASGRYSLQRLVEQFDEVVRGRSEPRAPVQKPAFERATRRARLRAIRAGSKVRVAAGKSAQPAVMATLVIRDESVRRLAGAARDGNVGLVRDLWRLAALRRAVAVGLLHSEPSLEDDGRRLVLTSRPGPTAGRTRSIADEVASALRAGSLRELIWNHSTIGEGIPLIGAGLVLSHVGDHGVAGAYSFARVMEVARHEPERVVAALAPLLLATAAGGGEQPAQDPSARQPVAR